MLSSQQESMIDFDSDYLRGRSKIVGIDEAGRGALAGPVVAATLMLSDRFYRNSDYIKSFEKLNDSKQIDSKVRDDIFFKFKNLRDEGIIDYEIGISSVEEVENLNILGATKLAMLRAIENLDARNNLNLTKFSSAATLFGETTGSLSLAEVIVDGLPLKGFIYRHKAIVKGDAKSFVIAGASIIAKVTRDKIMKDESLKYPKYDFDIHKGYGTALHSQNILLYGASPIHRKSFLKNIRGEQLKNNQGELF